MKMLIFPLDAYLYVFMPNLHKKYWIVSYIECFGYHFKHLFGFIRNNVPLDKCLDEHWLFEHISGEGFDMINCDIWHNFVFVLRASVNKKWFFEFSTNIMGLKSLQESGIYSKFWLWVDFCAKIFSYCISPETILFLNI